MPSTVIRDFSFDAASQILQIEFVSGITYSYKNVPEHVYTELKSSREKGIYFNKHIKGKYDFERKTHAPN